MSGAPPSYSFVALPPRAKDGLVVFGKNSARPRDEVQEVVYFPAVDHDAESKVEVSDKMWSLCSFKCLLLALPLTTDFFPGSLLTFQTVLSFRRLLFFMQMPRALTTGHLENSVFTIVLW
jgi:hypothetical protein